MCEYDIINEYEIVTENQLVLVKTENTFLSALDLSSLPIVSVGPMV